MKIKIYWNEENTKELNIKVLNALEELWLSDFINVEITDDENIKNQLSIAKEPALIVEEESIDFMDTIFEWIIPNDEEIKSMFISIIWWGENWASCWSWWSCWNWCSC